MTSLVGNAPDYVIVFQGVHPFVRAPFSNVPLNIGEITALFEAVKNEVINLRKHLAEEDPQEGPTFQAKKDKLELTVQALNKVHIILAEMMIVQQTEQILNLLEKEEVFKGVLKKNRH